MPALKHPTFANRRPPLKQSDATLYSRSVGGVLTVHLPVTGDWAPSL